MIAKVIRLIALFALCGWLNYFLLLKVSSFWVAVPLSILLIFVAPLGLNTVLDEYLIYRRIKGLLEQDGWKLISFKLNGNECNAVLVRGEKYETRSFDLVDGRGLMSKRIE